MPGKSLPVLGLDVFLLVLTFCSEIALSCSFTPHAERSAAHVARRRVAVGVRCDVCARFLRDLLSALVLGHLHVARLDLLRCTPVARHEGDPDFSGSQQRILPVQLLLSEATADTSGVCTDVNDEQFTRRGKKFVVLCTARGTGTFSSFLRLGTMDLQFQITLSEFRLCHVPMI